MKWITWKAWQQYVNTKTNKQKFGGFDPPAEVMSEVMPEVQVMSAETAFFSEVKWSEVFFIIVSCIASIYFNQYPTPFRMYRVALLVTDQPFANSTH